MKPSRLLLAIITLVFLFTFTVSTVTAGSMGNGAAQRQKLVIESVDVTTGAVVFKSMVDNTVHTYQIDATTRITIFGKGTNETIDQIKVGEKVENYVVKDAQPPQTLRSLFLSPAAPTPPAPAPVTPKQ